MTMIGVIVTGFKGRMGSAVARLVEEASDMRLIAGIDIGDSLEAAIGAADVVIDFTVASAAARHALVAARHGKAIVIGTTGLSDEEMAAVACASSSAPVVLSPNMSAGVNLSLIHI